MNVRIEAGPREFETLDEASKAQRVAHAIDAGMGYLRSIQKPDGCIQGEVQWSPSMTAQYVMVAFMTGRSIPEERRVRFIKHFEAWECDEGGWGMHYESPAYVYVTVLGYVALRILGCEADHPLCQRARAWLKTTEGVLHIPSWGKVWLAMMDLYGWEGVAPILPELWLQPRMSPLHPRRMYCHTRLIYLGLGYLYGARFVAQPDAAGRRLIDELREELYDQPYAQLDFRGHRYALAQSDLFERPHTVLRAGYDLCGVYDRLAPGFVRKKALNFVLEQVVEHQQRSRQAAISPVNGLLNAVVLHHADHPDAQAAFEGIDYWVWIDEEQGERFNGAHSHTWDTAFAVQAICEGPRALEHEDFLRDAARYFVDHQMKTEDPNKDKFFRDARLGGWCFSDKHHQWPVSDCTAEALSALALIHHALPDAPIPEPHLLRAAVHFVLSRQNPDGGWGSYERQRGATFLRRFNPAEMFGNCMIEYSYVECTASCMVGLRHARQTFGEHLTPEDLQKIQRAISRGAALLGQAQEEGGGWQGFWGVNYTYGTFFGVNGLLTAGVSSQDAAIRKAVDWVLTHQHPEGGWGESYLGVHEERYVPHEHKQVIMTSWALMTLLKTDRRSPELDAAIDTGVALLLERQREDGSWPLEGVGGAFFNTAMHHYCLYKDYFSVWALSLYARRQATS